MWKRYDAYLCGAVRQLGQGGGPFSRSAAPPACLPALTSPSLLPLAPQRRLIVSKPLLVSGELREQAELPHSPSLSTP